MNWTQITKEKKNILFVGESGCGKTELAINCAVALAEVFGADKTVQLIDMDQTKGVFRARECQQEIQERGVRLLYGEQLLDTPVVPAGVKRFLKEETAINILDIGGNEIGSVTMGQFSEELEEKETIVFFVINPYRLLSCDSEHIRQMRQAIQNYGRFREYCFIGNPNMGEYTDAQTAMEGWKSLRKTAEEMQISCNVVVFPEWIREEVPDMEEAVFIHRFLRYP